ncbi:MAG TPA: RnfABCDGE type electron transport complex subunit G [Candidatus Omnitrophota bacterium]|nr:RnfABCDGE type electron transport complex subunit G [Candidatus Omnitrophota bacterium]HPN56613.1 RnfABCDGE type electron transport complex subunit G [Candidatus Omnitrophota bacterium]
MKKKEPTFLNLVTTLFVATFVSSASLGFVYEVTKGPKARAELNKKIEAIRNVVPEFDSSPFDDKTERCQNERCITLYPVKKAGEVVGTAVESWTQQGFGGEIKLMVGFLPDGTIYDVEVLDHKETPGLGDKIDRKKSDFTRQFQNKNPGAFSLTVKKDGGSVDAITAATISSRAFCNAVQRAYDVYRKESSH